MAWLQQLPSGKFEISFRFGGRKYKRSLGTSDARQAKSRKIRLEDTTRKIEGDKFVAAFAQHILPKGFQKIRHYGWMNSSSKISLDEVKWLVWAFLGWTFWLASGHAPQDEPLTRPLRCSECGGVMRVVEVTYETMELSRGPPGVYIDSG